MNWFKRILDRLFAEGNETSEGQINQKNGYMDSDETLESKEKPNFRFPIITDAEIYGWDKEESLTERESSKTSKRVTEGKDFEPIPFYENERWPDKKEPNIYRANTTEPTKHMIDLHDNGFELDEIEDEEGHYNSNQKTESNYAKRFNPTNVPSPIFGFSNRNKQQPLIHEEDSTAVQEKSIFSKPAHTMEESIISSKSDSDEVNELPLGVKPSEKEEISSESLEIAEEPVVKKEEKVVPFNVLMLKSDKDNLTKKEQQTIENVPKKSGKIPTELTEEVHYVYPPVRYLIPPESQIEDSEWLEQQSEKLEESLSHFGVQATVIEAVQGPTVTRFELTVGQGTKVSRVRNLTDDLKLTLAAKEIRIQAPIPGKSSIGIEIPNRKTRPVRISEVIGTKEFMNSDSPLEAVLGLGLTGEPVTLDLRKMPHGLIAGATGSGKSVCINSILVSLLFKASPTDLKMMLIDPKMVELAPFNGIPHLISPVITDVKAATAALKWAVGEMERRYELLAHTGVRDIERYNKIVVENRQYSLKMPYLLIVIDELSDLMMMSPADVEVSIIRIAQKARACGIHLIIATQRPSVDVITGTIKANIPTRIAFSVSSQVDSRTIIDTAGAERLLGKGDMLYLGNGQSASVRLQGTFVTDDEIERIIEHVQSEASPEYLFGQEELLKSAVEEEESDPLFEEACLFIYEQGSASTSQLQRNFSIGYNRAAKLMDSMEKRGFISEQRGSRARDVFLTESDLEQLTEPIF